jgi:LacI family transcriptional regulator
MKRVTMSDIAKEAAVSKNTVSLALKCDPQIPESTRTRIQKTANKMGYQLNPTIAHLMAELRSNTKSTAKASLAMINANQSKDAFTQHPTVPSYVAGCRRRASQLGYGLDTFWLSDPELNGERLNRILKARGIRGIIIVGLMNSNRLPEAFNKTWRTYPCVVTGVRTRQPALSFACTDHHIITLRAFEKAIELGYKRPGLVLDDMIDQLVEGRFSAGYLTGQGTLPAKRRLKPFFQVNAATSNPDPFRKWVETEKPDVIFTLYNIVRSWLEDLGYHVPNDVGLVQLEWRKDRPNWAGMNQHNDLSGEAAVDMIISMIHGNESGVPASPRATLIGGSWVAGDTVKPHCAAP